jgi:hypothetical protein
VASISDTTTTPSVLLGVFSYFIFRMNFHYDPTNNLRVNGETLIAWGFKPGKWFKDAINAADKLASENHFRNATVHDEAAMIGLVRSFEPLPIETVSLQDPSNVPIHYNIDADTSFEKDNLSEKSPAVFPKLPECLVCGKLASCQMLVQPGPTMYLLEAWLLRRGQSTLGGTPRISAVRSLSRCSRLKLIHMHFLMQESPYRISVKVDVPTLLTCKSRRIS